MMKMPGLKQTSASVSTVGLPKPAKRSLSLEQFSFSKRTFSTVELSKDDKVKAYAAMAQYRRQYGDDYLYFLNWAEINAMLSLLHANKYPTVLSMGRPIRWEMKLEYEEVKAKSNKCCEKQR